MNEICDRYGLWFLFSHSSESPRISCGKIAMDAQMLKKRISRTCDEAARTILSSLLL